MSVKLISKHENVVTTMSYYLSVCGQECVWVDYLDECGRPIDWILSSMNGYEIRDRDTIEIAEEFVNKQREEKVECSLIEG